MYSFRQRSKVAKQKALIRNVRGFFVGVYFCCDGLDALVLAAPFGVAFFWRKFVVPENANELVQRYGIYCWPIVGGVLDYLNQLMSGKRRWEFLSFVLHSVTATFFGWAAIWITLGLGYEYHMAGGVAGLGGFLGTRTIDIIQKFVASRRK